MLTPFLLLMNLLWLPADDQCQEIHLDTYHVESNYCLTMHNLSIKSLRFHKKMAGQCGLQFVKPLTGSGQ